MGKFIYHAKRKQVDKRLHGLEQQPSERRETGNWILLRKMPKKIWFTSWIVLQKIPHIEKL
jgi:hypothetical protein